MLTIIRAIFLSLILYWLSKNLLGIVRIWLRTGSGLPLATEALLYKLCKILLVSISAVLVLHYIGIDLIVFAPFGGAMGLGIGFGLCPLDGNLLLLRVAWFWLLLEVWLVRCCNGVGNRDI